MKVKCIKILNSFGQPQERSAWLTIGKVYDVLTVEFDMYGRWRFRLIGDGLNGVALFEKEMFEVVSPEIAPNWIVSWDREGGFELIPEIWSKNDFWVRYYDQEPEALELFNKEMLRIVGGL